MPRARIAKTQYELLASLRHRIRLFLHFSEDAALTEGLTPQQHQALLAVKGFPGRDYVSVRELAERLQLRHNSAVGLVNRLVARGLAIRARSEGDRRRVDVRLTPKGEAAIARLSSAHLAELRRMGPDLGRILRSISGS
jgi:DNA-binding MarR family transcriptional regulator